MPLVVERLTPGLLGRFFVTLLGVSFAFTSTPPPLSSWSYRKQVLAVAVDGKGAGLAHKPSMMWRQLERRLQPHSGQ
jgi:hypothetical protein